MLAVTFRSFSKVLNKEFVNTEIFANPGFDTPEAVELRASALGWTIVEMVEIVDGAK